MEELRQECLLLAVARIDQEGTASASPRDVTQGPSFSTVSRIATSGVSVWSQDSASAQVVKGPATLIPAVLQPVLKVEGNEGLIL